MTRPNLDPMIEGPDGQLDPLGRDRPWLDGAACTPARVGADVHALFWPEPRMGPGQSEVKPHPAAAALCAVCPVRQECYDYAVEIATPWGVWGGVEFGAVRAWERYKRTPPPTPAQRARHNELRRRRGAA